jgi:ADP-ribose pyrophosphatase
MEWKKLSEERLWDGYRKLDKWTFELPNGLVADFEIKREGNPVCVLPITSDGMVLLARQFRPGPQKVLLELPGGGMEKGEQPLEAITREFLEETGYTGDFQAIGSSLADAYSDLTRYNFVATNCHKVQDPQDHEREPIELVEITVDDFRKHLKTGELTDIATGYLGLDHLGLL